MIVLDVAAATRGAVGGQGRRAFNLRAVSNPTFRLLSIYGEI
jgi:hypothetical protein